MGKGTIIIIKDHENGIVENENGKQIPFKQAYMTELALEKGRKVTFDVYEDPTNPKDKTAYNVELQQRGKIIIIKDTESGIISDPNFGDIPFYEPFLKEQGIAEGMEVKYRLIKAEKVGPVAVYLNIPKN
jgi:cold shock CspA family protein